MMFVDNSEPLDGPFQQRPVPGPQNAHQGDILDGLSEDTQARRGPRVRER